MLKLTVLYTPPRDVAAFDEHYLSVHMPLARQIPGLVRAETSVCVATPDGSPVPYYRIAELHFEDAEAMNAGLGTEVGQRTGQDAAELVARTGSTVTMVVSVLDPEPS
jgi:uncharacterized protein (TIGR02118 family)